MSQNREVALWYLNAKGKSFDFVKARTELEATFPELAVVSLSASPDCWLTCSWQASTAASPTAMETSDDEKKVVETKLAAAVLAKTPYVAVHTSPSKKRKVMASPEPHAADSAIAGTEGKQMSVVILKLGEIAKALNVMNGHLSVLARSLSGDRSRGKAAAAVGASYARAKLENEHAAKEDDKSSDDDDDEESDGDNGSASERKQRHSQSSLAQEVALNAKEKKGKDKDRNKENQQPSSASACASSAKVAASGVADPKSAKGKKTRN